MRISPLTDDRETYTFVFSFDDGFARYFSVTLRSLIDHKKEGCVYDVVVLHRGLSGRIMDMLLSMVTEQVVLRFFDVAEEAGEIFGDLAGRVPSAQWDVSTFYDLLVPLIMPEYERVMYCDSDLVFCEDPAGLFSVPFDGKPLIAVRDVLSITVREELAGPFVKNQVEFADRYLGLRDFGEYFNTGVLLFNNPAIDREEYTERVRQAFAFPELPTVDQDVLNYVFLGRVVLLPSRFNLQVYMVNLLKDRELSDPESIEFMEGAANPAILHFSAGLKPWKVSGCPKEDVFWNCAERSPFYGEIRFVLRESEWKKELSQFSVKRYLISRLLSKIVPGRKRAQYRREYEEQRRLYERIRSGR